MWPMEPASDGCCVCNDASSLMTSRLTPSVAISPCFPSPAPARRQRGAAVLVAMLVVAMAAVAASGFMFRSQVEWRRLDNLIRQNQARLVLRATGDWAASVLRDDAQNSSADYRGEAWATQLPPVEAEGFRVSGRIEDQDGRVDLNNLVADG
jgi:general secretion pathway protein K